MILRMKNTLNILLSQNSWLNKIFKTFRIYYTRCFLYLCLCDFVLKGTNNNKSFLPASIAQWENLFIDVI